MSLRAIIIVSSGISLSACTFVPARFDVPYSAAGTPLANSIVQRIRCELAQLVRTDVEPLYLRRQTLIQFDYHVAMLLSLDANDTASLAPNLAFPYVGFGFGITPSAKLSRQDQMNYNLNYSMLDMYLDWKANPKSYDCPDADTNLAGNLGIREKVSSALNVADLTYTTKLSATDAQFGGVINFTATKAIDQAGPTWTLSHFSGPGGFFAASQVNTDKLAFGFAPGSEIKVLPSKPARSPRIGPSAQAQKSLERALANDLGTQLNAIRNNQR